jgi:hypothetical protein
MLRTAHTSTGLDDRTHCPVRIRALLYDFYGTAAASQPQPRQPAPVSVRDIELDFNSPPPPTIVQTGAGA